MTLIYSDESVSAGNSSNVPLGAGETFTGVWEQNDFEHVAINVKADQDATLHIEFGLEDREGNIVTTYSGARDIYADTGYFRALVKMKGRAFRVRLVNGATPQTYLVLHSCHGNSLFPSSASDDNEILTTVTERERDAFVALQCSNVSATEYAVLIDLSDTANFPHDRTGRVDITNTYFSIDRDSTGTGSVRIGVITRVDGTNADIEFIAGVTFEKSDERSIIRDRKYSPSQLKCGVSGGNLTHILSNFTATNVAAVNTGAAMRSPLGAGTVVPGVGDIVVQCARVAGTYNASISCTYHGEASA